MNEKHKSQSVRRASKHLLNIYLILAVLFCSFGQLSAQNSEGKITGKVTSEKDGESLIGVSVKLLGTSIGTITDINGAFTLSAKEGETLAISYIGYIGQRVKVTKGEMIIRLAEDTKSLDEVIVIGYGVQKKKLNTGATVQVKGDELMKQNTTNALQAMQGSTPGVNITSTSGQPGKGVNVTIRGVGSINGCNPLYIVDGVQTGSIDYLSNSDIASIDVLKDAASAAIYGAQASNGVVLVTTRTGVKGKSMVSLDSYYGTQNIAKQINTLNADQYALIMNEQAINSGNSPLYPTGGKSAYLAKYADTNWLDAITNKNAPTYSHAIGINGGSDASVYSISLGITGQDGIIGSHNTSSYQRYNFKINTEHDLYKNFFKVGQHLTFSYSNSTGVNEGSLYSGNPIRSAMGTSPFLPMYDDSGNYLNNTTGKSTYKGSAWTPWESSENNPYAAMNEKESHAVGQKTIGDIYAEIQPIKGLKMKTVFGLEYNSSTDRSFMPKYELSMLSYNTLDYAYQRLSKDLTWNWDNTITYDFKINDHAFTALIGSSIRKGQGEFLESQNTNLVIADYDHAWISTSDALMTPQTKYKGGPNDEFMMQSFFGRLNYNYKEKYMVNATFRADGSSHFASGNRWGYFPSISTGWVISNEDFMSGVGGVDFLKLRASWGQAGNQNIPAWKYLSSIVVSDTYYYFGNGINTSNLSTAGPSVNKIGSYPIIGNKALIWETSEQSNIGIDAKFLQSKLGVNLDLYNKTSKDWLIETFIRPEAGGNEFGESKVLTNGGDVTNKGIELALTWNDKLSKDFNYFVNGNIAYNNNKVTNVPTSSGYIVGNSNEAYNNAAAIYRKAETGLPIGYFWGYKTDGILQNTSEVNSYVATLKGSASNTLQGRNITSGDVRYVDVNGDGTITEADKTMIGNPNPDFTFGLSFGFSWKALDFSVMSNGVVGNEIFQSYRDYGGKTSNYTTAILNRWHGEGTSNNLPRVTETNINYQISDIFIHKGDYLRISNIQVGYDFAKNIKWKYLSQLRLYFAVQNAFTFTKYDGMDPEVGYGTADTGSGSSSSTSGIDLGYYPRPRTILVGLNVKF